MNEFFISEIEEEEYAEREDIIKMIIEEGITEIPAGAFMHCINLKEVILPRRHLKIRSHLFLRGQTMS